MDVEAKITAPMRDALLGWYRGDPITGPTMNALRQRGIVTSGGDLTDLGITVMHLVQKKGRA